MPKERKRVSELKFTKRLCAMMLCIAMSLSSLTFADNGGEAGNRAPDYKNENYSYQYELFMEIFKMYAETHLYEFTEEELTEAFVMKLLHDYPELFKLFVNTMLGTMDEYSDYYEIGTGIAASKATTGYGISLGDETGYEARKHGRTEPGVYVTGVLYNSNVLKAGIRVGDRLVSVEGIPVDGITAEAALWLVRMLPFVAKEEFDKDGNSLGIPNEPEFIIDEETGIKTYPLHMVFERDGETFEVALTKGKMLASEITYDAPADKNYSYIAITSFQGETVVQDFKAALQSAEADGRKNLIIDLRGNGGGVLDYAREMADMLVTGEDKVMFYLNSRSMESPEAVIAEPDGFEFDKITLIVDEYSASASELFAMILQYHCKALLVGKNTYGKAVGQSAYELITGDMFTITTFEMLTPELESYNGVGLAPDAEIGICLKKYEFPEGLEIFNYINYKEMSQGVESETVLGFEKRMYMLGYLRLEKVDGIYDESTTAAINAMRLYLDKEPTGLLDDKDVEHITLEINRLKNYFYTYDSQLEVAEISFSSASQARRLAKELENASKKVEEQKAAYEEEAKRQAMEE